MMSVEQHVSILNQINGLANACSRHYTLILVLAVMPTHRLPLPGCPPPTLQSKTLKNF